MKKWIIPIASSLTLAACGGGGTSDTTIQNTPSTDNYSTTTNSDIQYQPVNSTGRLLASNCFQCHGTNGTGGFERISGGEASEIYEYRGKLANSDIMAPHGQGYTDAQLQALIGYLNQVR